MSKAPNAPKNRTTIKAEYIWLDGGDTQEIRSKTRVLTISTDEETWSLSLKDLPIWGFDGSSTGQSETKNSDLVISSLFL